MSKKEQTLITITVKDISNIFHKVTSAILKLKTTPDNYFGYAIKVTAKRCKDDYEKRLGLKYKKKYPKNCTYGVYFEEMTLEDIEAMDITYENETEHLDATKYISEFYNITYPTFIEYDGKDDNCRMADIMSYIREAIGASDLPENYVVFEAPDDMQIDSPDMIRTLYVLNTNFTKSNSIYAPQLSFTAYSGYATVNITVNEENLTKENLEEGYSAHHHYEFLLDINDQYDRDILSRLFTKEQIEEKAREYDDHHKVKTLYEQLTEYNLIRDDSAVRDYIKGSEAIDETCSDAGISAATALKVLGEFFLEDEFKDVDPTTKNNANVYLVSNIMNKYPTRLKKFAKAKGWNKPNGEKQQSDEC